MNTLYEMLSLISDNFIIESEITVFLKDCRTGTENKMLHKEIPFYLLGQPGIGTLVSYNNRLTLKFKYNILPFDSYSE